MTQYLPKGKHLQGTKSAEGRVCLGICVNSEGYLKTVETVFGSCGISLGSVPRKGLQRIDERNLFKKIYKKSDVVMKRKAKKKREMMKEQAKKEVWDKNNHKTYQAGIGGPGDEEFDLPPGVSILNAEPFFH